MSGREGRLNLLALASAIVIVAAIALARFELGGILT